MTKLDMKKYYKTAYTAKKEPAIVTIPAMQYVSFAGKGDPNSSPEYENAMGVLYGLAYTLKFQMKEEKKDFVVAPLEGQWWSDDPADFIEKRMENWLWNMMIALPPYIAPEDFERAREALRAKKSPQGLEKALLETIEDGPAVQAFHIGPYAEEAATIAAMHHYAEEQGYQLRGRHREVYMSNPQRTAPEKLKTIIRHPVERKG